MSEAAEEEVEQPHTEGGEHVEHLADKMAAFMRERGREKEGGNGGEGGTWEEEGKKGVGMREEER